MTETNVGPEEVLSQTPKYPTREQTLKTVQDKYPGHITWATDRGSFSGGREIYFGYDGVLGLEAEDAEVFEKQVAEDGTPNSPQALANLYFSKRANLLVVDRQVTNGGISYIITTQLDDDDLEEFEEVQKRVQLEMREWRERKAQDKEAAMAEAKEERRLIEVGRKAETYSVFKKNRELEEALAEARAEAQHWMNEAKGKNEE